MTDAPDAVTALAYAQEVLDSFADLRPEQFAPSAKLASEHISRALAGLTAAAQPVGFQNGVVSAERQHEIWQAALPPASPDRTATRDLCWAIGNFAAKLMEEVAASNPPGEVVVTSDEAGNIVAVTRQDGEGKIISVIAEAKRVAGTDAPEDQGDSYTELWNAHSAVDTAACMLPTFKVLKDGGLEATVYNTVSAIHTAREALQGGLERWVGTQMVEETERVLAVACGAGYGITAFRTSLSVVQEALRNLGINRDTPAVAPDPVAQHQLDRVRALDEWRAMVAGHQAEAYAEDALGSDVPWEAWEWQNPTDRVFRPCTRAIDWNSGYAYRRPIRPGAAA